MSEACEDAMREDLLIEELGKTLCRVNNEVFLRGGSNPEAVMAMAREVLRQMEFARRECRCECGHCGRGEGDAELKIAPPDWKP